MLNPNAAEFVPRAVAPAATSAAGALQHTKAKRSKPVRMGSSPPTRHFVHPTPSFYDVDDMDTNVTAEELEELEALEDWVQTMAQLEELEREHVMAMALSLAPKETVQEIERKSLRKKPSSKGKQQA